MNGPLHRRRHPNTHRRLRHRYDDAVGTGGSGSGSGSGSDGYTNGEIPVSIPSSPFSPSSSSSSSSMASLMKQLIDAALLPKQQGGAAAGGEVNDSPHIMVDVDSTDNHQGYGPPQHHLNDRALVDANNGAAASPAASDWTTATTTAVPVATTLLLKLSGVHSTRLFNHGETLHVESVLRSFLNHHLHAATGTLTIQDVRIDGMELLPTVPRPSSVADLLCEITVTGTYRTLASSASWIDLRSVVEDAVHRNGDDLTHRIKYASGGGGSYFESLSTVSAWDLPTATADAAASSPAEAAAAAGGGAEQRPQEPQRRPIVAPPDESAGDTLTLAGGLPPEFASGASDGGGGGGGATVYAPAPPPAVDDNDVPARPNMVENGGQPITLVGGEHPEFASDADVAATTGQEEAIPQNKMTWVGGNHPEFASGADAGDASTAGGEENAEADDLRTVQRPDVTDGASSSPGGNGEAVAIPADAAAAGAAEERNDGVGSEPNRGGKDDGSHTTAYEVKGEPSSSNTSPKDVTNDPTAGKAPVFVPTDGSGGDSTGAAALPDGNLFQANTDELEGVWTTLAQKGESQSNVLVYRNASLLVLLGLSLLLVASWLIASMKKKLSKRGKRNRELRMNAAKEAFEPMSKRNVRRGTIVPNDYGGRDGSSDRTMRSSSDRSTSSGRRWESNRGASSRSVVDAAFDHMLADASARKPSGGGGAPRTGNIGGGEGGRQRQQQRQQPSSAQRQSLSHHPFGESWNSSWNATRSVRFMMDDE